MHREAHHVVEAPFDPRNKRSSRGLQGEAGPECQTRPLPGSDPKRFVCVRVCIGMCAAFQDVPGCRTRRPCPWVRQTECTLRSSRARAERRSRAFPPKSNELLQAPRHLATSQPLDGQQNGVRARNAARGKCGVKTIPEHKRNPAVHGMRGSAERCEPARAAATGVSVRVRPNDHSRALAHHARSHEAAERSAGFWAWARTFPRREHGHGASRGSCPRAPPPCRPR